ncbi:MAG: hypothetical protein KatS3mg008_0795 [Acidimicrobiales bacterium]|nr:MAG: hypothetical protein KatS3mg008_0795 [Acidimicrobiales bacterium]
MSETVTTTSVTQVPVQTWRVSVSLLIMIAVMWLVAFDNGQVLHLVGAKAAAAGNWLHEVFHDGRHLLGVPCH